MKILTLENTPLDLNTIPDELEEDIRFSVLDNSDKLNPDFFFNPLVMLESFESPAIVLEIEKQKISLPLSWYILLGDPMSGNDLEVLPLTSLNDRGFLAFMFNPLVGSIPTFKPIQILNFYNDVKWFFPKMKNNQLLTVPIEDKENPKCIFITKDITKNNELIDYANLL